MINSKLFQNKSLCFWTLISAMIVISSINAQESSESEDGWIKDRDYCNYATDLSSNKTLKQMLENPALFQEIECTSGRAFKETVEKKINDQEWRWVTIYYFDVNNKPTHDICTLYYKRDTYIAQDFYVPENNRHEQL